MTLIGNDGRTDDDTQLYDNVRASLTGLCDELETIRTCACSRNLELKFVRRDADSCGATLAIPGCLKRELCVDMKSCSKNLE